MYGCDVRVNVFRVRGHNSEQWPWRGSRTVAGQDVPARGRAVTRQKSHDSDTEGGNIFKGRRRSMWIITHWWLVWGTLLLPKGNPPHVKTGSQKPWENEGFFNSSKKEEFQFGIIDLPDSIRSTTELIFPSGWSHAAQGTEPWWRWWTGWCHSVFG